MKKFAAFLMIVSVSCFSLVGCKPAEKAAPKDKPVVEDEADGENGDVVEEDVVIEETDAPETE